MLERWWCFASKLWLYGLEKICLNHLPLTCVCGKRQTTQNTVHQSNKNHVKPYMSISTQANNTDVCLCPILLGIVALWSHGTQIKTQNKSLVCLNCESAKTEVTPANRNQWSERTAAKPTVKIKLQLTNRDKIGNTIQSLLRKRPSSKMEEPRNR